jgi:hypothetical protein
MGVVPVNLAHPSNGNQEEKGAASDNARLNDTKPSLLSRLSGSERDRERRTVEQAWSYADRVPSDPESPPSLKRKRERTNTSSGRRREKGKAKRGSEEEEESRYAVARAPPDKQRRMDDTRDTYMIFTADDGPSANEESEPEEGEHDLHEYDVDDSDGGGDHAERKRKTEKAGKNRSYWLSKGMGLGDDGNDSS